jgi:hypothetical protein
VCADPGTLVYVKASTCPQPGNGTLATPYCKIKDGLDRGVTANQTVIVFPGSYDEKVTVMPGVGSVYTVTAVGVGGPVIQPTSAGPVLTLDKGGGATSIDVTLDGFTLRGATGASGHGVLCSNGGNATKLTLLRSTVRDNAQNAVNASSCTIVLDQDVIGPANTQGGVFLSGSDFTLTNLLVVGNGTGGATGSNFGGINVASTGPGAKTMFNLTVVNNQMRTGLQPSAGIGCAPGVTLANVVLVENAGGAAEIDPTSCTLNNSAWTGAPGGNGNHDLVNCGLTPAARAASIFDNPTTGDYHPKRGGAAPCTLVGLGTPTGAPTVDLEGRTRPNPPSIGALEAK